MKNKKKIEKARKHLAYAREHLEYLRSSYVELLRSPEWQRIRNYICFGENPYDEKLTDILHDMADVKERIARFERIVK